MNRSLLCSRNGRSFVKFAGGRTGLGMEAMSDKTRDEENNENS